MKQGEYNTVVMMESGKGMSIPQEQIAPLSKAVVIDVGPAHGGLVDSVREGKTTTFEEVQLLQGREIEVEECPELMLARTSRQ